MHVHKGTAYEYCCRTPYHDNLFGKLSCKILQVSKKISFAKRLSSFCVYLWKIHFMDYTIALYKPILWVVCLAAFLISLSIYLYRKESVKVFRILSKHLMFISLFVWLSGILLYAVGLYSNESNWFSVMPRAIVSSFKMFLLSESDFNKDILGNNIQYMSWYSIIHLAAAFISFLFLFKMLGYKIKSSLNLLLHRWFKAG